MYGLDQASYDPNLSRPSHGERVEARQRERADKAFFGEAIKKGEEFFAFWRELNSARRALNRREATYGAAREAFDRRDDKPPVGTITYVGDAGTNVRAVPFGGGYQGHYRVTDGKLWRIVRHGITMFYHYPVVFIRADDALKAAKAAAQLTEAGTPLSGLIPR